MKLVTIILLVALAVLSQANLQNDLSDFERLIPKVQIGLIVAKHMIFDSEFKRFKNFVQSSQFNENCEILKDNNEVRIVMRYLEESGLNDFSVVPQVLKEEIDIAENINMKNVIIPRSVMSFIDEVVDAFSRNDVSKLMKYKIQTSPDFKYLYERLRADEFYQLISDARNSPEVVPIEQLFRSKGLKVDKIINIVKNILNWAN